MDKKEYISEEKANKILKKYDKKTVARIIKIISIYDDNIKKEFNLGKLNSLQLELFMRIFLKNLFSMFDDSYMQRKLQDYSLQNEMYIYLELSKILKNEKEVKDFYAIYNEQKHNYRTIEHMDGEEYSKLEDIKLKSSNEFSEIFYSVFERVDISNPNNDYGIQELDKYKGITKYLYKNLLTLEEKKNELNRLMNSAKSNVNICSSDFNRSSSSPTKYVDSSLDDYLAIMPSLFIPPFN